MIDKILVEKLGKTICKTKGLKILQCLPASPKVAKKLMPLLDGDIKKIAENILKDKELMATIALNLFEIDYEGLFEIVLKNMDKEAKIWCDKTCEAIKKAQYRLIKVKGGK
jgi:hypothetical protein